MQLKYIAAAIILAAVAATGWVLWHHPEASHAHPNMRLAEEELESSQSAAAQPSDARVARQVAALQAQVARLQADLGAIKPSDIQVQADSAQAQRPPQPTREEQERLWQEHVAEVHSAFDEEPRNPGWAQETAAKIRAVAASDENQADLITDIECRSHSCRVELAGSADVVSLSQVVDQLTQGLAGTLPNATVSHDGNGDDAKPNAVYLAAATPEDSIPAVARR